AEAIGIDVKRVHWIGFAIAGAVCGIAGGLFAFAKGSISPETVSVGRSIDGLVMVLLGGIQTLSGPIVGASTYALLQDTIMRQTEYWRALLGLIILALVLAFPGGIVGALVRFGIFRRGAAWASSTWSPCRNPSAACMPCARSASASRMASFSRSSGRTVRGNPPAST